MNVIIILILVIAETAGVFFTGFMTSERRHAAADAAAITQSVAIAQHTKVIVQERVKWRTKDATSNVETAKAVAAEIAASPTPPTCPPWHTSLYNSYIARANAAGRVSIPTEGDSPVTGPSH